MRTDPILRNRQVGKLRLLVDNIDLGPMLPLKSMKVPMVRALAKSHISIYGLSCCGEHVEACCPCCSQKPWGCLWSKVPSETITSPYPTKNVLMPIDCVPTGGHVDAGCLYSCLKRRWCTWTRLLAKDIWVSMAYGPEATLISGACATTENHDSVRGPYWKRGPCWRLWSVLPPEVILMSMVQAVARNKVKVHNPCSS